MMRERHAYILVRTVALHDLPGRIARCDYCDKLIHDSGTLGAASRGLP